MSSLLEKLMKAGSDKIQASVLSTSDFFNDSDFTTTPIPLLNGALGGRLDSGLRSGLLMVCGESKTFKTSISLFMVGAYLNRYEDAVCLFYDTEFGSTPDYFSAFGVPTDRVLHIPIENLEQLKFDMSQRIGEITKKDKVIVFVDSVGNIASKKEVDDAQNENSAADMSRAKQLKSLWRIVTPMLKLRDIPCIAINHIYMDQGMYPKAIVSGGSGGIYSANDIWIITKSQEKDNDGDLQGFKFTINIEKSRMVKEKSKFPLTVNFDGGISKFSGMLDLALDFGYVVKPKVGWFQLADPKTGELIGDLKRAKDTQTDAFLGVVMKNPGFQEAFEKHYRLSSMEMDVLRKKEEETEE